MCGELQLWMALVADSESKTLLNRQALPLPTTYSLHSLDSPYSVHFPWFMFSLFETGEVRSTTSSHR